MTRVEATETVSVCWAICDWPRLVSTVDARLLNVGGGIMRRFEYEGAAWEVSLGDLGIGVGFGDKVSPISQWEVVFTCVSDPTKGSVCGQFHERDLSRASDSALARALSRALQ